MLYCTQAIKNGRCRIAVFIIADKLVNRNIDLRNTPDFICKKQKQKTSIISANKYIYHMERAEGVTFEKWDEARYDAEQNVSKVIIKRGYAEEEYEEQRLHLIIEEACRKCGMKYYRRKR